MESGSRDVLLQAEVYSFSEGAVLNRLFQSRRKVEKFQISWIQIWLNTFVTKFKELA
jgi:hypothetical protein